MADIRALTEGYVAAFDARDLDRVAHFMNEGFALTDPGATGLTPKAVMLSYIQELFDANDNLHFLAHRILVDGDASAIHFTLTLKDIVLDGVDVITWNAGKMIAMHAYLTPRTET